MRLAGLIIGILMIFKAAPVMAIETYNGSPEWKVGCEAAARDQFGDAQKQYCWMFVHNPRGYGKLLPDNSYVMTTEDIFKVDKSGIHVIPPKSSLYCKAKPRRMAVDGKRIDGLPVSKQIEAILSGREFIKEKQAEYPYCGIAPYGTFLDGVRSAFQDMNSRWSKLPK